MCRKIGQPGVGCKLPDTRGKVIKNPVIGKAILLLAALLILFEHLTMTFFFILLQVVFNVSQLRPNLLLAGQLP